VISIVAKKLFPLQRDCPQARTAPKKASAIPNSSHQVRAQDKQPTQRIEGSIAG